MDEHNKPQNVPASDAPRPYKSIDQSQSDTPTRRFGVPRNERFRGKKGRLTLLISIAVLLGIFALAYVYWFQNPNKVVSDGLSHAFNANSLIYTGTVTTVGPTRMNADIDGGVSSQGGTVNAKFTFDTNDKKYTLAGNGLMDAKGDLYLKVDSIDELVANYRSSVPAESQSLFDQIIDKINDKWVKIGADDIKEYNPSLATAQKCSADAYEKMQSDKSLKSELIDAYKSHPFIAVDKTLGAENGSLGYRLTTNDSTYKSFVAEYKKTAIYAFLRECDDSFTIDENKAVSGDKSGAQIDVWIDRWSHQITRLVVKDDEKGSTRNISIEPTFNRTVKVQVPKDATTIEQLQKDIMSLLQSAPQSASTGTPAPQTTPLTES